LAEALIAQGLFAFGCDPQLLEGIGNPPIDWGVGGDRGRVSSLGGSARQTGKHGRDGLFGGPGNAGTAVICRYALNGFGQELGVNSSINL
jgi:hypothetical protein